MIAANMLMSRSQPAARVAADVGNFDDEYVDVEDEDSGLDQVQQLPIVTNSEAMGNLSMIMEQSFMDADFNLHLSGMKLILYCKYS